MDEASGHSTPRSVVNVRGQDSVEKIFNDDLDFEEYIGSEEIETAVLDDELLSCLNKYSCYSVGGQDNTESFLNEGFYFEELIGADEIENVLLADELSCLNKYADVPVTQGNENKLEENDFSGVPEVPTTKDEPSVETADSIRSVSMMNNLLDNEGNVMSQNTLVDITVNFSPRKFKSDKNHSVNKNVKVVEKLNHESSYWIEAESVNQKDESDLIKLDESFKPIPEQEEDWISITLNAARNKVTPFIGIRSELFITIVNKTNRWLNVKFELRDTQEHAYINIVKRIAYIGPSGSNDTQIDVTPQKKGDFEIKIIAFVEDTETKDNMVSDLTLCLCGLEPQIEVTSDSSPESIFLLDFGFLPESCQQTHTLSVKNLNNFDIPVLFNIKEQSNVIQMFSLVETSNDSIDCSKLEKNTSALCILHTGQTLQIAVVFSSPKINLLKNENGIADVRAILDIKVAESNVILKEIALIGKVGYTRLLLSKDKIPIVFYFELGNRITRLFPIRNCGCVPLNLAIRVDGASIADMVIDPSRLCIPPGRASYIEINFLPKRQQPFQGTLVIEIEPNGKLVHVNVTGIPSTQCNVNTQSDGISEPMGTPCKTKFPVKTTHKQLVWGSVCVGKQESESCTLFNESNSTVKLQASLDDEFNSFKLINDEDQSVNELDIIIHSMERVKFNVVFNPPKIGSAIAKVIIKQVSSSRGSSRFVLPLHGYGGHVKVDVKGVSKDITGRMWLSMGLLDSANSDMCSEFLLSNTGTLDAFAIIKVIPKGFEVTESDFAIKSPYLVIGAGASVRVKISFHLQREVYEYLSQDKKDVIEIGLLEITTGDEPSRQRIRSMLNRAKNSYQEEKLKISHMSQLCKNFPGEVALGELEFLNDPDYNKYNIIRMLNRSFICEEILLTVEKNLDKSYYFAKSMMVECGAKGNSRMFTIHNAASTPFTTPNAKNGNNLWNISPSLVFLMPPHVVDAGFLIANKFQTSQTFEARVSNSCLLVAPLTGTIQPNDDVLITVSCSPSFKTRERELQSVIRIYLGNGVKEIKVRIKYVNN